MRIMLRSNLYFWCVEWPARTASPAALANPLTDLLRWQRTTCQWQQFSCAPRRLPIGDTADYQSALQACFQGKMRIAAPVATGRFRDISNGSVNTACNGPPLTPLPESPTAPRGRNRNGTQPCSSSTSSSYPSRSYENEDDAAWIWLRLRSSCRIKYPSKIASHHQHGVGAAESVVDRLFGRRVADPLSINEESVLVATWRQPRGRLPPSNGVFAHRRSFRVPFIERPRHRGRLGLWHIQNKLDWLFDWPPDFLRTCRCDGSGDCAGLFMSSLHG